MHINEVLSNFDVPILQLYANHFGRQYIKQWQVLCDQLRKANESEYISPCLASLAHNVHQSSFCRFYKLPASFLRKVKQFNSSRISEVS